MDQRDPEEDPTDRQSCHRRSKLSLDYEQFYNCDLRFDHELMNLKVYVMF